MQVAPSQPVNTTPGGLILPPGVAGTQRPSGLILPGTAAQAPDGTNFARSASGLLLPDVQLQSVSGGALVLGGDPSRIAPSEVLAEARAEVAAAAGPEAAAAMYDAEAAIVARVDADRIREAMVEAMRRGDMATAVRLAPRT